MESTFIVGMLESMVTVFAALFPIVNPPGAGMMFYSLTRRATHDERAQLAKRIALNAFAIIMASLLFGAYVLQIFGVSIPVLRVSGGIVVALTGWKLLNAPIETEKAYVPIKFEALIKQSFYPLTMPLTTGPGTIAVTIAVGATHVSAGELFSGFLLGALLATLLIAAMVYLCDRYADTVERMLGDYASDAIVRLFAFILMCIGIQVFWDGFTQLWDTLGKT